MANPENIVNHQFTSENQPAPEKKSRKGIPNRATVYKKILAIKTEVAMPDGTKVKIPLYEAIALGQAKSAMKGNTNAWKEIQDSLYGKLSDKTELTGKDGGPVETRNNQDLSKLSTEELLTLKDINKKLNS